MPTGIGNISIDPQLDANYVPSNAGLIVVPKLFGVEYDKNKEEREYPTTIGAIRHISE